MYHLNICIKINKYIHIDRYIFNYLLDIQPTLSSRSVVLTEFSTETFSDGSQGRFYLHIDTEANYSRCILIYNYTN